MSVHDAHRRERSNTDDGEAAAPRFDAALLRIGDALRGMRFGTVLAVVQDGVVVQIERTEKTRLEKKTR
jgi:hypothetical protein